MEPVKNVGTVDYAMTVPQAQNQVQGGYEDYSSMPMVYDPAMEEKSNAASNKTGLVALGTVALAGIALYGGYRWGKSKTLKDGAKELTDDAKKAFEDQIAKLKNEKDKLQKCNDDAVKITEERTMCNPGLKRRCERIKKALKPDGEDVKKAEETASKTTEEVKNKADDAADAAKETTNKD